MSQDLDEMFIKDLLWVLLVGRVTGCSRNGKVALTSLLEDGDAVDFPPGCK